MSAPVCPVCEQPIGAVHLCEPKGSGMTGMEPVRILALAEQHLARYKRMHKAGLDGDACMRIEELTHFITVWNGVVEKGGVYLALSTAERAEVDDAIADEDDG